MICDVNQMSLPEVYIASKQTAMRVNSVTTVKDVSSCVIYLRGAGLLGQGGL